MPVGTPDNPKKPLMKGWNKWTKTLAPKHLRKLIERYPNCNIGMICGRASGLVVVDIDDGALVHQAWERFGETDAIVNTPGGGCHLYYRYEGEASCDLRKSEGLPIEIKSDGAQVLLPSSRGYRWFLGGPERFKALPPIRAGALGGRQSDKGAAPSASGITKGHRNNTLFQFCLREVRHTEGLEQLVDAAHSENAQFEPPLSDSEVLRIASSAWKYELLGDNWVGCGPVVSVDKHLLTAIKGDGDAFLLYAHLQICHGARHSRDESFAIAARAMARDGVIADWGERRYRSAIKTLERRGLLECVARGGKRAGDSAQYRFGG